MIIYDNFVHADCHAGNLLVEKKTDFESKTFVENFIENCYTKVFDIASFA